MCVAVTLEQDATLTLEECEQMARGNNDGYGIAFAKDGKVWWIKGATMGYKRLHQLTERYKAYPRLVHFRFSTAGGNSNELCHPFSIDHRARCKSTGVTSLAMIHNGHWGDWDEIYKDLNSKNLLPDKGPWSDTRLGAYLISADPAWIDHIDGKIATLDGRGDLVHTGLWTEIRTGVMVSNTYWRYSVSSQSYSNTTEIDWEEWWNWRNKERTTIENTATAAEPISDQKPKPTGYWNRYSQKWVSFEEE